MDGTLVDTVYLHTLAWWKAFDEAGETRPMADIHPLIGMGGDELVERLLGSARPELDEVHGQEFSRLYPMIRVLPGATDLLSTAHRAGMELVLVTSSKAADLPHVLTPLGPAQELFAEVIHGEDGGRAKPAPDLFHLALDRTGRSPDRVIAVGDAEWDITASGRAGIDSIGLRTGGMESEALRRAGALAVYDSCTHLLQEWRSSPLA